VLDLHAFKKTWNFEFEVLKQKNAFAFLTLLFYFRLLLSSIYEKECRQNVIVRASAGVV